MRNPKSVLEKETHKILWDFEIQTDHLISASRPDQVIVNENKKKSKKEPAEKRTLPFRLTYGVELKESEKRDKCLYLVRELNYGTWK